MSPFGFAMGLALTAVLFITIGLYRITLPRTPDVRPGDHISANLGIRASGSALQQRFLVRNPLSTPLSITGARSTCGCTVVSRLAGDLAPGESRPLDVRVETGDRTGLWSFSAIVTFVDEPPAVVNVVAELKNRLPHKIALGHLLRGSQRVTHLDVVPATPAEHLKISEVSYDRRYFDVSFAREGLSGDAPWLEVKLQPTAPTGGFDKEIIVNLKGDADVQQTVHLSGWIDGVVEARKPAITFEAPLGEERAPSSTILLYSPYGHQIRFVNLSTDPAEVLRISATNRAQDGTSIDLDVELDPSKMHNLQAFTANATVESDGKRYSVPIECFAGEIHETSGPSKTSN